MSRYIVWMKNHGELAPVEVRAGSVKEAKHIVEQAFPSAKIGAAHKKN